MLDLNYCFIQTLKIQNSIQNKKQTAFLELGFSIQQSNVKKNKRNLKTFNNYLNR